MSLWVDIDEQTVERLKRGEIPIFEPNLAGVVKRSQEAGRLGFTTDAAARVPHGLFQFIAVGAHLQTRMAPPTSNMSSMWLAPSAGISMTIE
jgi:UDP-glucose 6-dehydrogenase